MTFTVSVHESDGANVGERLGSLGELRDIPGDEGEAFITVRAGVGEIRGSSAAAHLRSLLGGRETFALTRSDDGGTFHCSGLAEPFVGILTFTCRRW